MDLHTAVCTYTRFTHGCLAAGALCGNLLTPANGEISSCSSGTLGEGDEGDTCSFTCNTGYELTGSDTRTCQSDGSWSGSDAVCRRGNIRNCHLCIIQYYIIITMLGTKVGRSSPY